VLKRGGPSPAVSFGKAIDTSRRRRCFVALDEALALKRSPEQARVVG
jgi:hypothetical protein